MGRSCASLHIISAALVPLKGTQFSTPLMGGFKGIRPVHRPGLSRAAHSRVAHKRTSVSVRDIRTSVFITLGLPVHRIPYVRVHRALAVKNIFILIFSVRRVQ